MNTMTVKTKEFKETVEEFKTICMMGLASAGAFDEANELTCKTMQVSVKLFNQSMDLLETQAKVMDEMNEKLDKILAKKN